MTLFSLSLPSFIFTYRLQASGLALTPFTPNPFYELKNVASCACLVGAALQGPSGRTKRVLLSQAGATDCARCACRLPSAHACPPASASMLALKVRPLLITTGALRPLLFRDVISIGTPHSMCMQRCLLPTKTVQPGGPTFWRRVPPSMITESSPWDWPAKHLKSKDKRQTYPLNRQASTMEPHSAPLS